MSSIIKKLKQGDSQAIESFHKTYSPKIARFLRTKLGREEDAQEILDDIFFEAIDSIIMLKDENKLTAWLFKIAHNKVADFYRKRKIKVFLLSQIPLLELVAEEIYSPDFQFEKNKLQDSIETALSCLSAKHQQVLRQHYEEHIPVKRLAIELDLSYKATESLLYRARQQFIKYYERT